jgi:hypothetical protein
MTRLQKKAFKKQSGAKDRARFIDMLLAQQSVLGRYTAWANVYRRKCAKKGVDAPV